MAATEETVLPPPDRTTSNGNGGNGNGSSANNNDHGGSEDSKPESKPGLPQDVCREYIRGSCFRGSSCKFRHPMPEEMSKLGHKGPQFCHDFQNRYCSRPSCRYTHATKEEEMEYFRTGMLPARVLRLQFGDPDIPMCRDFLKQQCTRGKDCKFRHLTEREIEQERRNLESLSKMAPTQLTSYASYAYQDSPSVGAPSLYSESSSSSYPVPSLNRPAMLMPEPYPRSAMEVKRRRLDDRDEYAAHYGGRSPALDGYGSGAAFRIKQLEDDNAMLMRKVDDYKRQMQDLSNTNDQLLEQNARLRSQLQKALMNSPMPMQMPNNMSHMSGAALAQPTQQPYQHQAPGEYDYR